MPERSSYKQGTPSWVDLSTTDQDGAKSFYSTLFGWVYEDNPIPDGSVYSMAQKDGKYAAAIFGQMSEQTEQGIPSHWQTYITVDDVEATTAKVAGAGGSVVAEPFDVMEAGRMSVISDPTGGMVSLWQTKQMPGAQIVNEPNTLCWNELITPDPAKAVEFYKTILGVAADTMPMEGMPDYTIIQVDGEIVAGVMQLTPEMKEMGVPPHWFVYFAVESADGAVETVKANGGAVHREPFDIPPGRMAVVADPTGAAFGVIKMNQQ